MIDIQFEWNEKKDSLNKKKHSVSFKEAQRVFSDEKGLLFNDAVFIYENTNEGTCPVFRMTQNAGHYITIQ